MDKSQDNQIDSPLGFATLDIDSITDEGDIHEMILRYTFPVGEGVLTSDDSALARPLKSILEAGLPIEKLAYVFFRSKDSPYYSIGSFVRTSKRIIFFPALRISRIKCGYDNKIQIPQNLDHLTMEKDWTRWHFKTNEMMKNSANRFPTNRVKFLRNNLSLWFVMTIGNSELLEKMPKVLKIKLKCPSSVELRRRATVIFKAREDSTFPTITLKSQRNQLSFLNFEFYLTFPHDILFQKDYLLPKGIFAPVKDLGKLSDNHNTLSRFIQLRLEGADKSIIIRASQLNGILNYDSTFVSGNAYTDPF